MNEIYTYEIIDREENKPIYKFAEIENNRIINITEHWIPLDEYKKLTNTELELIDITGIKINNQDLPIGYCITNIKNNYIVEDDNVCSIAESKAKQIETLKIERNKKELEPIKYKDNYFDADKDSLMRLNKARQTIEDNNAIENIEWTTAGNIRVVIGLQDFININSAIANRSNELHTKYNILKKYINNIDEKYSSIIKLINLDWDTNTNLEQLI